VIDLGYVTSSGYQNATAGINCYCGILYAQPPLGDLRWRKPCPIETSNNFGGQSTNATKIGGHTQNYTDLWRKLNADQTGCRMGQSFFSQLYQLHPAIKSNPPSFRARLGPATIIINCESWLLYPHTTSGLSFAAGDGCGAPLGNQVLQVIVDSPTYHMATTMSSLSHNSSTVFKMTWAAGSYLHGSTTIFLAANETG
jgi:hypothetical protein